MTRSDLLQRMTESGVIAVVRAQRPEQLVDVARALVQGGVCCVEITLTVPNALDVIRAVTAELKDDVLVGAGTVLDTETARAAILAGARYIVTPVLRPEVIVTAHRYDVACFAGAFTPTEILTAWEAGADVVKVFPASVGGPDYFKAVRGPLPQVRLMPTGGVNLNTAADFIKAGACLLAVGGELVKPSFLETGDMTGLSGLAGQYVDIVRNARQG